MKTFLKVKILSLWEEAKIIRDQEKKAEKRLSRSEITNDQATMFTVPEDEKIRRELYGHRKGIVAQEMRATLIAYGYLRGKELIEIEMQPNTIPLKILKKAKRMVLKYGLHDYKKALREKIIPGNLFNAEKMLESNFNAWLVSAMEDGFLNTDVEKMTLSTIAEFFRKESAKSKKMLDIPPYW